MWWKFGLSFRLPWPRLFSLVLFCPGSWAVWEASSREQNRIRARIKLGLGQPVQVHPLCESPANYGEYVNFRLWFQTLLSVWCGLHSDNHSHPHFIKQRFCTMSESSPWADVWEGAEPEAFAATAQAELSFNSSSASPPAQMCLAYLFCLCVFVCWMAGLT